LKREVWSTNTGTKDREAGEEGRFREKCGLRLSLIFQKNSIGQKKWKREEKGKNM